MDGMDRLLAAIDELRTESRTRGEETAARLDKIDRRLDAAAVDNDLTRREVHRIETRLHVLEQDFRQQQERWRSEREEVSRERELADATLNSIARHVEKATSAFADKADAIDRLKADLDEVRENDKAQNFTLEQLGKGQSRLEFATIAITEELDIADRLPTDGEGPRVERGKSSRLRSLARDNKVSGTAAGLAALAGVIQLALELLRHH
jgi:chromosome segregation ATPase